jgi:hypothetical protein
MDMLGKDPKRFNKIQAFHDKHEKLAALNKADADADDDSENPTDDEDDDDELEETARDDSTKKITTKTGTTKKSASKKKATTQSATTTPAPPTIQGGRINVIAKGRNPDIRSHRPVNFGYRSAPSDSEWEEKRRTSKTLSGRTLKLVKLKETIDRHAVWCPFVHLNKKLHHAHRRIRALQHRPNDEAELPETLDELDKRLQDYYDRDDDHIEKEDTNGEDEDSDSMEAIMIQVPRKRKTQVMAAFEKKTAQVEQLAPSNDDEPKKPTGADSLPGNENASTSIVDATAGATDQNSRLTKATRSKDEALSRTSRAQSSFPDSDIAVPGKDVDHQENSHSAPSTTPDDHKSKQLIRHVNAVPQPSVELDETARAMAAKKRKASEIEPNADAEPVSKTRKIRAD